MRFVSTPLPGSYLIELDPHSDDRGFFARTWCSKEFGEMGIAPNLVQCNISFNRKKGTLRGMHFQKSPYAEAKVVRCTRGKIYDVMVDLRPESSTFKQWFGAELSAENRLSLYIPEGFAHGFLTLSDDTEVLYLMSEFFHSECAAGVRWDDPAFSIAWPGKVSVISDRDASYPDFPGPVA